MTMPLITPVGSNFLKDWPSQNAVNCNLFDTVAGPCLTSNPLNTYIPLLTAATTNPTMGTNPIQIGYFYLVFDMVFVFAELRLGTGSTRGSGVYAISLPFKSRSTVAGVGYPSIGNGQMYNVANTGWRQPVLPVINSNNLSTAVFNIRSTGGTSRQVTESFPWNIVDGDGIMFSARYQRDTS